MALNTRILADSRARIGLPLRHPASLLGTWFGAGLLPGPSGSWGSLAALPFAWAIESGFDRCGLALAAILLFWAGCRAADIIERESGVADHSAIVVDEVAAQWLVLAAVPRGFLAYLLGFALFRLFDIWKPWPISVADRRIKGGFGVMFDDVLAAYYAALVLTLLLR